MKKHGYSFRDCFGGGDVLTIEQGDDAAALLRISDIENQRVVSMCIDQEALAHLIEILEGMRR